MNRESPILDRSNSTKVGIVGVFVGAGLTATGAMLIPLVSLLWPVLMIIAGGTFVLSGLDNLFQTPLRPLFSRGFWGAGGGSTSMRREAEREAEEREKIESGEAD